MCRHRSTTVRTELEGSVAEAVFRRPTQCQSAGHVRIDTSTLPRENVDIFAGVDDRAVDKEHPTDRLMRCRAFCAPLMKCTHQANKKDDGQVASIFDFDLSTFCCPASACSPKLTSWPNSWWSYMQPAVEGRPCFTVCFPLHKCRNYFHIPINI